MKTKRKSLKFFILIPLVIIIFACSAFGCSSSEKSLYNWAIGIINTYYYEDISADAEFNGSVKQFVSDNLDIYSAFYTKDEYAQVVASNSGSKTGLGISMMYIYADTHPSGKDGLLIMSVVGNSPAYRAGLQTGEIITSVTVGEQTAEGVSREEMYSLISSAGEDDVITLDTDRHSGYTLSKASYTASYCYMATATKSYYITYVDGEAQIVTGDALSYLPSGTAYLKLRQFYGNAAEEMALLLERYNDEGCTTLILDLRENGGGYVSVMANIANLFPGTDTKQYCMYAKYKDGDEEAFKLGNMEVTEKNSFGKNNKLYVLADNGTASASEALIGVLYCNGVIDYSDIYISDFSDEYLTASDTEDKDCRTYGKGIMQSTYVKPFTGEALKLTTAKIYWPDGETSIHGTGLNTSLGCNTLPASWAVTYGDEQLQLFCSTVLSSGSSSGAIAA